MSSESLKILMCGKGHLTNDYAGVDGGSNIRIPLINELFLRGHKIDWTSFALNMELQHSNIDFLGIQPYVESCEEAVRENILLYKAIDKVKTAKTEDVYDALVLEARPSWMYEESYLQNTLIKAALKRGIAVLVLDQDLWADTAIDASFRPYVRLMRPYEACNFVFPYQEMFAYYHHNVNLLTREPMYDVVYIGNRYEREADFIEFMRPIHDANLSVLVSGDWVIKAPYVVKEFPKFHWIGSTRHSYTLPLLQRGRCTVHVGRKVMRQYGLTPVRPFEAYMAGIPCFVKQYDVPSTIYPQSADCVVREGYEVVQAFGTDSVTHAYLDQGKLLRSYTTEYAAEQLVSAIRNQKEMMLRRS